MPDRRNIVRDRRAYRRIVVDTGEVRERRRGRKPRSGERATERIEFVVTKAERDELDRVAEECKLPLAEIIREAVNEYVSDYSDRKVF